MRWQYMRWRGGITEGSRGVAESVGGLGWKSNVYGCGECAYDREQPRFAERVQGLKVDMQTQAYCDLQMKHNPTVSLCPAIHVEKSGV